MSDVVIAALVSGLLGGLIGSFVNIGISRATREDSLRLAAVDKRLAVHQEAFALWRDLLGVLYQPQERNAVVIRLQTWWKHNCLYLDEESRESFYSGLLAANVYDPKTTPNFKKVFRSLLKVKTDLQHGVGLPAIGEHEFADKLRGEHEK